MSNLFLNQKLKGVLALCIFICAFSFGYLAKAADYIEVDREFSLITSQSMQGFLKPLFTTLEEGFNSNLFTRADYKEGWSVGLDISIMGMFIPNSQRTFDAIRPEDFGNTDICRTAEVRNGQIIRDATGSNSQPTIYGGESTAIYSSYVNAWAPDSLNKTVTYIEGNDIDFMSGLPNLQFTFGFPTRTELRLRWLGGIQMEGSSLSYFGFVLNQQIDHFFDLFEEDDRMGIALNFAFHTVSRDKGLSMNSFAFGAHYSYEFIENLIAYGALQYETIGGTFEAKRETSNPDEIINSPYKEVQRGENLKFDIEGFNNFRGLLGIGYQAGAVEFHFDASLMSQPSVNFGMHFHFGTWGEDPETLRKIKKTEKIKKFERIEEKENSEEREEIEKK